MKNVLAAFDKFKGSLTAQEACEIATKAILATEPTANVISAPLTDGGEGFCKILTDAAKGKLIEVRTLDARFSEKPAHFGIVELDELPSGARKCLQLPEEARKIAVVEMAQASDLVSLPDNLRNPWEASSAGTGMLLREAANLEVDAILLGIGGSATNDIGLGALEALGAEFIDKEGVPIVRISPKDFDRLEEIDLISNLLPMPPILIACDVENPLLGEQGATKVFAPQKGLPENEHAPMEEALSQASILLCQASEKDSDALNLPGAGAAGGIGLGLHLVYGAVFLPGFELVSQWLNLDHFIRQVDLLLTGEGRFDQSSLLGKGPWALIQAGAKAGKQIHVHAGSVAHDIPAALPQNAIAKSITPENTPLEHAFIKAPDFLYQSILNTFLSPADKD
jgi:glycerate kinase